MSNVSETKSTVGIQRWLDWYSDRYAESFLLLVLEIKINTG